MTGLYQPAVQGRVGELHRGERGHLTGGCSQVPDAKLLRQCGENEQSLLRQIDVVESERCRPVNVRDDAGHGHHRTGAEPGTRRTCSTFWARRRFVFTASARHQRRGYGERSHEQPTPVEDGSGERCTPAGLGGVPGPETHLRL
ncbi:hypothetical protein Daura_30375 [Dactylosporangium aurantiacum]|uniref:Uncharacterized protein n=1 Tax=Dactylosporangium aurantiacum TaxID=35754 RepID=A0A9Q9M9T8_9ACTN|nr:hypothetical protein [Dactylosporangium aurantiacum]MDG6108704.1 hypothetical protein [Dactylosporangium aurantiacum]UWZ51068.1 hypothetical protein Daura_30375 [Dactylosporangium aurantiacum]